MRAVPTRKGGAEHGNGHQHGRQEDRGHPRPRLSLARGRSLRGIGYATPTAVIVTVFFLVPLVLVFWMSVNRWPLLGTPTFNAPDNFTKIPDNQLFVDAVWFTLKYTVITTVVLSAGAMGLALMVQGRRRGVGLFRTAFFLPGAIGFAAAALLFYGFYSESGPLDTLLQNLGIVDEPVELARHPERGAVLDDRDGRLALRRASTC